MEDTPSKELLEIEAAGWLFKRNAAGRQEWYLPKAFMNHCTFDDAVKLNKAIQGWSKK